MYRKPFKTFKNRQKYVEKTIKSNQQFSNLRQKHEYPRKMHAKKTVENTQKPLKILDEIIKIQQKRIKNGQKGV